MLIANVSFIPYRENAKTAGVSSGFRITVIKTTYVGSIELNVYFGIVVDNPTNMIVVHTHKGCVRQSWDSPTT